MVAASVLCGAVSADSPKFRCDFCDCFYETSYDVDSSDCSDYDDYDELDCCSDVCGDIDPTYYAPTDIEFMHELHGPDNCGVYCQLRYEIRTYGCVAPMEKDLANYDPGPGKIFPESGSVMAMSDFADDIDAELGEPFLPSGVH